MVRAINKITTRVKYCTKCVNSNLRPRLTFDNKGVCDACQYAFKKHNTINWKEREKLLKELCDKFRSKKLWSKTGKKWKLKHIVS